MHLFGVSLTEPELIDALVIELTRGYSFEETLEQVYKIEARRLSMSQMIIARAPVGAPIDPIVVRRLVAGELTQLPRELRFFGHTAESLAGSFSRFPGRPVHLLFSDDYTHHLSANLNPSSSVNPLDSAGAIIQRTIALIQRAEMEVIVESGRARFPAIPQVFYQAPNGRLVRSFLRIGNIQRSRAAIDALFFWLLPHLRGCAAIITDTWSIGSIALNASRRLSSYRSTSRRPCAVEMVSSYLDGSNESAAEAADHIERLLRLTIRSRKSASDGNKARVVFLMSGTSTGDFHARVCTLLEQRRVPADKVHFVSLFNLGAVRSTVECLVDWSDEAGEGTFAPATPATLEGNFETIKIDPQTYFPAYYIDVIHQIRERELQSVREFLDRYSDISPMRVHRTVTDDGAIRHHAISVDTVTLCGHQTFKERLVDKLLQLDPPPKLVITPVHDAGRLLGATAVQVLRKKEIEAQHIMHADLLLTDDRPTENRLINLLNSLDERASILILDDAFITGRRLIHYQMALRRVEFRGRVHYLVAVARPSALSEWEYRRRMLRARPPGSPYSDQGNTVYAIEAFPLPDWTERECPWCNELRIYQTAFSPREGHRRLSPMLRERRQLLEQSTHVGLRDGLFCMPPGVASLSFTRDSKFATLGMSQASVFTSVASGIQTLRSSEYETRIGKPALGPRHYPVATVLDHSEYLFGTYTDSLLRACLLRAGRDYELVYTSAESEKQKSERAMELLNATSPIENDVSAEIIIAILARKFPQLNLKDERLRQRITRLGLAEMFGDLLDVTEKFSDPRSNANRTLMRTPSGDA